MAEFLKELNVDIKVNEDDNSAKVNCLLRDGCCCKSHCAILHKSGGRSRTYQALVNIQNEMFDTTEDLSYLMKETCDDYHDDAEDANDDEDDGAAVDSLSSYLLNFKL